MKSLVSGMALVAATALMAPLAAQQHAAPRAAHAPGGHAPGAMAPAMAAHVHRLDSLGARLDTMVARMNRAAGDARTPAMQDLLRELVAAHKEMLSHMREMAGHHPMGDSARVGATMMHQHPAPAAGRPDSAGPPRK